MSKPFKVCVFVLISTGVVLFLILAPWRRDLKISGPPPRGAPLVFPHSASLASADFQSWKEGGAWKPVPLKDAQELVTALSSNYRYFNPPEVACALFAPPEWRFRLKWREGTEMLVPLTWDASVIQFSEKSLNGVPEGMNYGTYIVTGANRKDLANRCVGLDSGNDRSKPDPGVPK